jgi:glycosyltransferase involved in cell wall biosynthesis
VSGARILVVSTDHVGLTMAGPGIRAYRFATELARENDVTLTVPFETDVSPDGIEIVQMRSDDDVGLTRLVDGFDTVVAQQLPVLTMHHLAGTNTRTVYDLYNPAIVEQLAFDARRQRSLHRDLWFRCNSLSQEVALRTGDAFICASERQRDLWLGALVTLGRLDQSRYRDDPSLRDLIDVVPFGVEPTPPEAGAPVLKGVVPGIGPDDKLLLWSGGIWDWFDPLTVIRAVHELSQRRADVRLYFLGVKHPNPEVAEMTMVGRAVELAEELGLRDRVVFFNFGWVPYADRGRYLLEADLAVSAHFDDIETRFAFRTRLVDCFWAGLPVVTTRGDALSQLIAERELGRVVDFENVRGWTSAIEALLDDEGERARLRANAAAVREELAWPRVVATLARLAAGPATRTPRTLRERLAVLQYARVRMELAVRRRGIRGTASKLVQRLR